MTPYQQEAHGIMDLPLWNYVIYGMTGNVDRDPIVTAHGAIKASSSSEAEERALLLLEGHRVEQFTQVAIAGGEYQPGHFLVDVKFLRMA